MITAQAAKLSLDGQNIYNNCCTLRIEYSKLSNLNVKYNNDKSRDYTNPSLPTGDPGMDALGHTNSLSLQQSGMLGSPFAALGLANLANQFGAAGQLAGLAAIGGYPGSGIGGAATAQAQAIAQAALGKYPGAGGGQGCVLLISNMNEELTQPDHLFILFGVYGDVQVGNLIPQLRLLIIIDFLQRVKILFNKKDTALIQMAEAQQAALAINHLDKTKLWGKIIRVMHSKHTNVQVEKCRGGRWEKYSSNVTFQLPKDGQPDAGLTKDYANSGLHRFKKPGSKNYQNIYPPSATLHLSNIPSGVEEEDLRKAFQNINISVQVSFYSRTARWHSTRRTVAGESSSAEERRTQH